MKEIMKQNKNSSAIRISSFALALFVLFISISVPVFAYTDSSSNGIDFSNQPIPVLPPNASTSSQYLDGIYISSSSLEPRHACVLSSDENLVVYSFIYNFSNTFGAICFVSTSNTSFTPSVTMKSGSNYYTMVSSGQWVSNFDSTTGLYYSYYPASGGSRLNFIAEIDFPIFTDIPSGLSAVRDWIDNPPAGPVTPHQLSLSVPAGNALYIDVTGISTVRASLSMTSEVAHPQLWVSNQYYGFASSYPSSIAGNPSGSTPIPWYGYGDKTILNRYKSYSWSLTSAGNSNYLFICNPYATIDEYDQSFNPTIYITVQEAVGYKYYQLTGGIGEDGTIGQHSDGTTASGSYDSETDSWTTTNDETGLPWTPQEGGGNIITQNSINSWLQQISTQIGNFFAGAIGAVTTLVSAGSDFIHSLSGLYAWLPAPVYSVLVSALILVITIGVIKVFI